MGLRRDFIRTPKSLKLVHYWYEPYHKFGLIFLLVWDLICMAFNSHLFLALLNGECPFPQNIFIVFSSFMLILAPTYWMLLFFVNKTMVRVSKTKIIVQSGPLPSFRKDHSFSLQNVCYIKVQEHSINKKFENAWQAKADEICNVKAILRNGTSINILENIQTPAEAQIVRMSINSWLLESKRSEMHQGLYLDAKDGCNSVLSVSRKDNRT